MKYAMLAALVFSLAGAAALAAGNTPHSPLPAVGRPAPDFAARDVAGKTRRLSEFRGRPAALFFFCGCPSCKACAPLWAQVQRSDFMHEAEEKSASRPPVTLVVFLGPPQQARSFAQVHSLDLKRTVVLPDPRNRLGLIYRSTPCPRAWVIDSQGIVRYTNEKPDELPQQAAASIIISRTQDALARCAGVKDGQL